MYKCLMMALEKQLRIEQIEGEMYEEMPGEESMSGRRGRAMNGRYISRDGGNSYSEGFSRGYSEAMRQSGHYPMPDGRMW